MIFYQAEIKAAYILDPVEFTTYTGFSLIFKVICNDNVRKKRPAFMRGYGRILDKVIVTFKAGDDVFAFRVQFQN